MNAEKAGGCADEQGDNEYFAANIEDEENEKTVAEETTLLDPEDETNSQESLLGINHVLRYN